jgi:hypothetical protein
MTQSWSHDQPGLGCRVARWFVFKPKISIWVWPFVISYRDLGYFMTILYILCSFGTFFPGLVLCSKKNLATLCVSCKEAFT